MLKPVIRVTQLEAFRRWVDQHDEYATEESVIDTISGSFKGNSYTRIGTAFHSIVETGHPVCTRIGETTETIQMKTKTKVIVKPAGREFDIDGVKVRLDVAQCKVALQYRDEHPYAFHEVRLYKDYGSAIITGCADMVDGLEIRDIKTKYSSIKDEDYIASCQWKFYLEMFKLDYFFFDLFEFKGYSRDMLDDVRGLECRRYLPAIECRRYPGMETDNEILLKQFLEWANDKKLTKYLVSRKY